MFSFDFLRDVTNAICLVSGAEAFERISTDTRQENQNAFFIALKGDSYDAHDYLDKAIESGAKCLIVHKKPEEDFLMLCKEKEIAVLLVEDTLFALQNLANAWRRQLGTSIIGITGTNGKTSTKSYLSVILSKHFRVHASKGSFNNHWGVPLSLLEMRSEHQWTVQEMGMNRGGEIEQLVQIAEPNIVLVTNVGRGHIENFSNGIDGVAEAKAEIYKYSDPNCIRIFNLDNRYTLQMKQDYQRKDRALSFSVKEKKADIFLELVKCDFGSLHIQGHIGDKKAESQVALIGEHNVENLAAAAAAALAAGMPADKIWQALPEVRSSWGRNQILEHQSGAKILFDAYNANPESFQALLKHYKKFYKEASNTYLILGEMMELGNQSAAEHRALAEEIALLQPTKTLFFGSQGEAFQAAFESAGISKSLVVSDTYKDSLASKIGSVLKGSDILVIKGSRAWQLERAVRAIGLKDFKKEN